MLAHIVDATHGGVRECCSFHLDLHTLDAPVRYGWAGIEIDSPAILWAMYEKCFVGKTVQCQQEIRARSGLIKLAQNSKKVARDCTRKKGVAGSWWR